MKLPSLTREQIEELFFEDKSSEEILEAIWPHLEELIDKSLETVEQQIDEIKQELSDSTDLNEGRMDELKSSLLKIVDDNKKNLESLLKKVEEAVQKESDSRFTESLNLEGKIERQSRAFEESFAAKSKDIASSMDSLRNYIADINLFAEETKALLAEDFEESKGEILNKIEELRKDVFSRINKGGGNMNRQINVSSSVMSQKYTDINFQNTTSIGWTAVDDDTNKRVNIRASVLLAGAGGGGGSLTVKEADGTPTVASVTTIVVTNGTLTDDGSGQVTIATGGGGTGITRVSSIITANTAGGSSASTDYVYICAAGLAFTLPDAGGGNNLYTVKNATNSSVLVTAVAGDTMDGSSSVLIAWPNQSLNFTSDGTNYQIN